MAAVPGDRAMKCSRCNRNIKAASVISGDVKLGPVCARKMGLTPGKREHYPTVQAGQLPLFQPEAPAL